MIYLKFDNEAQMCAVLDGFMTRDTETVTDEDTGEVTTQEVGDKHFIGKDKNLTHGNLAGSWELWVRGVLSKPTGEVDEDENPIMEPLTGYHVDINDKTGAVMGQYGEDWTEQGYILEPQSPMFTIS